MTGGTYAGVGVGALVFLCVMGCVVWWFCCAAASGAHVIHDDGFHDTTVITTDTYTNNGPRNYNCTHGLALHYTPDPDYTCDGCKRNVPMNTPMYGCRICDLDYCTNCYQPPAAVTQPQYSQPVQTSYTQPVTQPQYSQPVQTSYTGQPQYAQTTTYSQPQPVTGQAYAQPQQVTGQAYGQPQPYSQPTGYQPQPYAQPQPYGQ